ncbi:unnamed protein product [Bursaphelenchus xylophilus]|uniref:Kinesin-like protein n=2 Tax=Bursaphelenchus xylophilus TaxID=6326 RepID=A0A7I8WY60_BURXY|nr:unnamed protein product [Bursaphelenchus xylophilus]CAG9100985.1 unnamed protein product [Bursaphelenchus xylophilus]
MDCLAVGMSIMILRSDGRQHSAIIAGVRPDSRMIDVEWFENGETKGKAMELAQVLRFNPDLLGEAKLPDAQPKTTRRTMEPSRPSPVVETPEEKPALRPPNTNRVVEKNRQTIMVENGSKAVPERKERTALKNRQSMVELPKRTPVEEEKKFFEEEKPPIRMSLLPPTKSEVVKQVEELQKNRNERRQQQEDARRQRDNLKNLDPGNPNWEFQKMIRDYRANIDFRPLRMGDPVVDNRICVCVRKRPMSKKEVGKKEIEVITIPTKDTIIVHQPQMKVDLTKYLENQKFRFDYAFDDTADNTMVYRFTAQPLVKTIFQQGFATCFAYGQTGSGKTHTMGGDFEGKSQDCAKGIYALAATDVFAFMKKPEFRDLDLHVDCSFFELYGSKAYDLLNKKASLRILEDNKRSVQIVGLKEFTVHNAEDVLKLIREGSSQRTAGQTSANNNSSRSHAIFQIILKRRDDSIHGKFSLIDLAGNERGADTKASNNQTRMEGGEINKSLLSLKECIRAMGMMKEYVPFRGSKLTLVLRDSFIGKNAKTCMIATISPSLGSAENSLNTLRYANRAKELASDGGNDDDVEYLSEEDISPQEEEEPVPSEPIPRTSVKAKSKAYKAYQQAAQDLENAEGDAIGWLDVQIETMHSLYSECVEAADYARSVDYDVKEFTDKFSKLEENMKKTSEVMSQFKVNRSNLTKTLQREAELSQHI